MYWIFKRAWFVMLFGWGWKAFWWMICIIVTTRYTYDIYIYIHLYTLDVICRLASKSMPVRVCGRKLVLSIIAQIARLVCNQMKFPMPQQSTLSLKLGPYCGRSRDLVGFLLDDFPMRAWCFLLVAIWQGQYGGWSHWYVGANGGETCGVKGIKGMTLQRGQ